MPPTCCKLKGGAVTIALSARTRQISLIPVTGTTSSPVAAGVDFYLDVSGVDTLHEVRNLNFLISDAEFRVSGQERDLLIPEQMNSINESEIADATDPTLKGIGVFEKFEHLWWCGESTISPLPRSQESRGWMAQKAATRMC